MLEICIWTDIFKYYVNLSKQNGDKSAILNLILTTLHRIHGRIVVNACVKYRKKIFIGVGDIPPDGQILDSQTDGLTEPKSLSPTIFCFYWGDSITNNIIYCAHTVHLICTLLLQGTSTDQKVPMYYNSTDQNVPNYTSTHLEV